MQGLQLLPFLIKGTGEGLKLAPPPPSLRLIKLAARGMQPYGKETPTQRVLRILRHFCRTFVF